MAGRAPGGVPGWRGRRIRRYARAGRRGCAVLTWPRRERRRPAEVWSPGAVPLRHGRPGAVRLTADSLERNGSELTIYGSSPTGPSSWQPDDQDGTNTTEDRKSTRLNSSHVRISYAVFCLKKKKKT